MSVGSSRSVAGATSTKDFATVAQSTPARPSNHLGKSINSSDSSLIESLRSFRHGHSPFFRIFLRVTTSISSYMLLFLHFRLSVIPSKLMFQHLPLLSLAM